MLTYIFALLATVVSIAYGRCGLDGSCATGAGSTAYLSAFGGTLSPNGGVGGGLVETYTKKFDFAWHAAVGNGNTKYGRSFGSSTASPRFPTSSFKKTIAPTKPSGKTYLRARAHVVIKVSGSCPGSCTASGMPYHYWMGNGSSYFSYVGPGGAGNNGMSSGVAAPAAPTLTFLGQTAVGSVCYVECEFEGAASNNGYGSSGTQSMTIEYKSSSPSKTDLLHASTTTVWSCDDPDTDWNDNGIVSSTSGPSRKRLAETIMNGEAITDDLIEELAATLPFPFTDRLGEGIEKDDEAKRRGWSTDGANAHPSMGAFWQS